uniref:Septin n=1 Tax=Rhabditophanes sp. KR3021 TaxID=114890 RepID=A0AC35U294_9BILA
MSSTLKRSGISVNAEAEYIGIVNYTNQVFRRTVKNGFEFTVMTVGLSGLGKSTFLDTLFLSDLDSFQPKVIPSTKGIEERSFYLTENKVKVKLTLVDTPGFGSSVNNTDCWKGIVEYVDSKYGHYLAEQNKITRKKRIPDTRVHLCLYFIAPTGHSLTELDIKFLQNLHNKVNIVPVIAKADTLTTDEMTRFKENILKDIKTHGIKTYSFNTDSDDNSSSLKPTSCGLYGVVSSNHVIEGKNGKKIRARQYPWGAVEIENIEHNDFAILRDILMKRHLIDLICDTDNVHYENYRVAQLSRGSMKVGGIENSDPMAQAAKEKEAEEDFDVYKTNYEKTLNEKVIEKEMFLKEKESNYLKEENNNQDLLNSKRLALQRLEKEIAGFREVTRCENDKYSPTEKKKKLGLGLFNRS